MTTQIKSRELKFRRIVPILFAALAILAGLLFAAFHWSPIFSSPASAAAAAPPPHSSNGLQGNLAPDFSLKTLDGRTVKLSDFRGKVVLLNFWASYCAPCRVEMPSLVDLYKTYQPRGFEIVGVSIDDPGEQSAVARFLKEMNVGYTILLGTNSVADLYGGARLIPHTFFISRDGTIVKNSIGLQSKSDLESEIQELLAAPAH
jgi:peroxiredoxin